MTKFGFLKRKDVTAGEDGWRWMPLPEITPQCRLLLACGVASDNDGLLEETLARLEETQEGRKKAAEGTRAEQLRDGIEEDRDLIGRHLLHGWEGMYEADEETGDYILADGELVPIPFDEENARDFIKQCPASIILKIRQWAVDRDNFIEPTKPLPDGNTLGKA